GDVNGGVQLSGTNQLFENTDQLKAAVRVPIPLPNPEVTLPTDANGVTQTIIPNGEGPAISLFNRDVGPLGCPDGRGNTVTVDGQGSVTRHTPTSDVTTFGQAFASQQGNGATPPPSGTLTHQLIDGSGQRTDQYTWQGGDGSQFTRDSDGTLNTTQADGS